VARATSWDARSRSERSDRRGRAILGSTDHASRDVDVPARDSEMTVLASTEAFPRGAREEGDDPAFRFITPTSQFEGGGGATAQRNPHATHGLFEASQANRAYLERWQSMW
jgi:hypothetical protein